MPSISDDEFGEIIVRRSAQARSVRLKVLPGGGLVASLPKFAPLFLVKSMLKSSREEIRKLLSQYALSSQYHPDMLIGKSHRIQLLPAATTHTTVTYKKPFIELQLAADESYQLPAVQNQLRTAVATALRIEAKAYLPRRLEHLATQTGLGYSKIRFAHASSRWGSCSSSGTISLNIALMKLPFELIDYVLLHELCHTAHMNHSLQFWGLLERYDPGYKVHKKALKSFQPHI